MDGRKVVADAGTSTKLVCKLSGMGGTLLSTASVSCGDLRNMCNAAELTRTWHELGKSGKSVRAVCARSLASKNSNVKCE